MFGQVQCLEFLHNGKQFASSSDITKRNSTDKGIIIWEFDTVCTVEFVGEYANIGFSQL